MYINGIVIGVFATLFIEMAVVLAVQIAHAIYKYNNKITNTYKKTTNTKGGF